MNRSLKILLVLMFVICFSPNVFCYDELVGKRVEIHGPFCWASLGVAIEENTGGYIRDLSAADNEETFYYELNSFDVIRIDEDAKALVLDVSMMSGLAKITLLSGIYRGRCGWIPVEWLNGNEERPGFTDYPPDYPKSSVLRVE